MSTTELLVLFSALLIKHFVVDFVLQTPYQFLNKGKYGHPGGLLHSTLHAVTTVFCFIPFAGSTAVIIGCLDGFIHYHIDFAKVNINERFNWTPNQKEFWWSLGLDQLFHYMTYIFLIWIGVDL